MDFGSSGTKHKQTLVETNVLRHCGFGLPIFRRRRPSMAEEPTILSKRADAQAPAKTRRAMRVQRQEACRDLVAPGYSHRQIAGATRSASPRSGATRDPSADSRAQLHARQDAKMRFSGNAERGRRGVARLLCNPLKTLDPEKKMKGNENEFRPSSACFDHFAASRCGFANSGFRQGSRFRWIASSSSLRSGS